MINKLNTKDIFLTKPLLPAISDLEPLLQEIWSSSIITNRGEVHQRFEEELCKYLGVNYISLISSGTLALIIALKALDIKSEVITTPFTHISTSQALHWNNNVPVFADIEKRNLNINPTEIEKLINKKTEAILAVHTFGNECDIEKIDKLAKKHDLKVIYDAAHCFGVKYKGESICNYGDLSVLSFHATKVFNTIEGGAIISHDRATKEYIDALSNSGMDKDGNVIAFGFNAKMNDVQAAYGLVQLKQIDLALENRKKAVNYYKSLLKDIKGISLFELSNDLESNYSYMPILIDAYEYGKTRDELYTILEKNNIHTKKYFDPLVTDFDIFKKYKTAELPIAEKLAKQVLCLPLSHEIKESDIDRILSLF